MSLIVTLVPLEEGAALVAHGYTYLDVRSEAEFAEGRAVGAINVPWRRTAASGMVPNPDFIVEAEARFARDAKLLVACKANGRARAAAEALVEAGFVDVVVLRAGFDGIRDQFGRVVEAGWGGAGLPVESD